MTSRRKKLEREIEKAGDPLVQIQLRNLLDNSEQKHEGLIKRVETALVSRMINELARLPAGTPLVLIIIVIVVIMLIIFLIVESGG